MINMFTLKYLTYVYINIGKLSVVENCWSILYIDIKAKLNLFYYFTSYIQRKLGKAGKKLILCLKMLHYITPHYEVKN